MIHDYIARMYEQGRDGEARRALAREIARQHTDPDSMEPPSYQPTEAEIDAAEVEYYASRRRRRYGAWESQLEEIYEQGEQAWRDRIAAVKDEIPKPGGE